MALVVLGSLVQAVSGEVGGAVFHSGRRAGVVAKLARRSSSGLAATSLARGNIEFFSRLWGAETAAYQAAWNAFAAREQWTNRLGVRRRPSGAEAFVAWMCLGYPRRYTVILPPGNVPVGVSAAPVVTAASFTAGGPYNATTSGGTPGLTRVFMYCRRMLQFGPRTAVGASQFIYMYVLPGGGAINWYSRFVQFGVELQAGELIRISMRYHTAPGWPSMYATRELTVS